MNQDVHEVKFVGGRYWPSVLCTCGWKAPSPFVEETGRAMAEIHVAEAYESEGIRVEAVSECPTCGRLYAEAHECPTAGGPE